jgi:hypothetical protein
MFLSFILGLVTPLSFYAIILPAEYWKSQLMPVNQALSLHADLFLVPIYLIGCFFICSLLLLFLPVDPADGA